ncbi:MAG: cyclodeaminase/cyclohydrolase family protein [Candidatus Omnitrophica bacterium]|nr:cyclodeaminase/cyclohydrolase family protein [Candidatus Omnitrophota bacterium]
MYINQSLKKYLDDLAARQATPGGGSAAALTGALAAGLLSMVSNYTLGNPKYKAVEEEVTGYLKESESLRLRFMELIDLDAASYDKVYQAQKLPKETPEEKNSRREKIREAVKEAAVVPIEICQLSYRALKFCEMMLEKTNVNLVSDLAVSGALLEGGFKAALINVEINISSLDDTNFIVEVRKMLEPMEKEVEVMSSSIQEKTKEIITRPKG